MTYRNTILLAAVAALINLAFLLTSFHWTSGRKLTPDVMATIIGYIGGVWFVTTICLLAALVVIKAVQRWRTQRPSLN